MRVLAPWRPASKARFFPVDRGQNAWSLSRFGDPIRAFEVLRTVVGALGAGSGALVAGVTRDTHDCEFCVLPERKRLAQDL